MKRRLCMLIALHLLCVSLSNDCNPIVKLKNCDEKENPRRLYYVYPEEVLIMVTCRGKAIGTITWELVDIEKGSKKVLHNFFKKQVAIFKPGDVHLGLYDLIVSTQQPGGGSNQDKCRLRYSGEPPQLGFAGGHRMLGILADESFTVDLSLSLKGEKLEPKYNVSCLEKSFTKCRGKCSIYKPTGVKYTAKLNPCTYQVTFVAYLNYENFVFEQTFIVFEQESDGVRSEVICEKNCDHIQFGNYSKIDEETILKLKCTANCEDFDKIEPVWGVRANQQIVNLPFKFEQGNKKVTIPKNSLQYDTSYVVNARYKKTGKKALVYTGRFIIHTPMDPGKPVCTIKPIVGFSLSTKYVVNCTFLTSHFRRHRPLFRIRQNEAGSKEKGVIIMESPFYRMEMYIAVKETVQKEQILTVEVVDELGNKASDKVPPITVKVKKLKTPTMNVLLEKGTTFRTYGNNIQATQILVGMLKVLSNDKQLSKEDVLKFQKKIMARLQKIQIVDQYQYDVLLSFADNFVKIDNADEELKKMLSAFCMKVLSIKFSQLYLLRNPELLGEDIKETIKKLQKCIELDRPELKKSPKRDLKKKKVKQDKKETNNTIDGNTTTPFFDELVVTEDYKNYESGLDDDKQKQDSLNAVKAIVSSSEMTEVFLKKGENFTTSTSVSNTSVYKDDAENFKGKVFQVEDINVTTSEEFANKHHGHIVSAQVTSFIAEALDPDLANVQTNIVDVSFTKSTKTGSESVIGNFKIEFKIIQELDENSYEDFEFNVTSKMEEWIKPAFDYQINVHRLNVRKAARCYVKLFRIQPSMKLKIVFTKNERPKYQHFKTSSIIDGKLGENHSIPCTFKEDFKEDVFVYMGVLPHKDMRTEKEFIEVKYSALFTAAKCLTLDSFMGEWMPAECKVNVNENVGHSVIQCDCHHTSLYAGSLDFIHHKLDKAITVGFQVTTSINYMIFGHVVFIFLCYCFALMFYKKRLALPLGKGKVVFLCDNRKNDRYAYFIIVKTGNHAKASTTSNICIQLYGSKCNSLPHVLNYPDPRKRFLQLDKFDWFVLTTIKHLGNINFIEIWTDSVGCRPAWYCENITIIDLQTDEEFFFQADCWLSVLAEHSALAKLYPTEKATVKRNVLINLQQNIRFYMGGKNTWNIFTRSDDHNLEYHERITLLLSVIYTTYNLIILFLGPPRMSSNDAFSAGAFQFNWYMVVFIILSSTIACAINFPFKYFFRNCRREQNKYSLIRMRRKYGQNVKIVNWCVLMFWITLNVVLLISLGFWVPFYSSLTWILCTFLSLLFSIFIVENVFQICKAIIYQCLRKVINFKYNIIEIIREVENQRKILFKHFGEFLLRPYLKIHYTKMPWDEIVKRRGLEFERKVTAALFKDLCIFIVYLLLLYIMTMLKYDQCIFLSNKYMRIMVGGLMSKNHTRLQDVHTINDIYDYLNNTIISILFSTKWYEGFNMLDPGLTYDFNTKIMGIAQIRQKVQWETCDRNMENLSFTCTNNSKEFSHWEGYNNGSEISSYIGHFETYSGSGFVMHLGRTLYNANHILKIMRKINWINIYTKVVFVEFWTYNCNCNVFNMVRVVIERGVTDRFITSIHITTLKLIGSSIMSEYFNFAVITLFFFIVMIFLMNTVIRIVRLKTSFFKNLWNISDIFLIIFSFAIVVVYFEMYVKILTLLKELAESSHNEFVNYFDMERLARRNNLLCAGLVFVSTVRLWKFLRFLRLFSSFERAIVINIKYLGNMLLIQLILLYMFSMLFRILLKGVQSEFRTIAASFHELFMQTRDLRTMDVAIFGREGVVTYVFYCAFMVISIMLYSLYCSLIILGYQKSKEYFSNRRRPYNLMNYVTDEFKFIRHRLKQRLRAGMEGEIQVKFVTPKADPERYKDIVSMSKEKINLMRLSAIVALRNYTNPVQQDNVSEKDIELMECCVLALHRFNNRIKRKIVEREIFFKHYDHTTRKVKFVPNEQLLRMEYIVERMMHHESYDDVAVRDVIPLNTPVNRLDDIFKRANVILKVAQHIKLTIPEKKKVKKTK